MLYRPPFLKKGDNVKILSTARKIDRSELHFSIELIKALGIKIEFGDTIDANYNQYAGSDDFRATDFQLALDDPTIDAILFARGGYGSIRIFDKIDWTTFINKPKWLIGFSDITIWHNLLNNFYGIETIHAPMCSTLPSATESSITSFTSMLQGHLIPIEFPISKYNKNSSKICGEIIGGNLSLLYSFLGTDTGFNTNNKILFIEDIDEYLYHIDRMMISLKRAKKLIGLKALIVGGFSDLKDNSIPFGTTYQEIILEQCQEYDFPIIFDFPVGHIDDNHSIILGANIQLELVQNTWIMTYL